VCLQIQTIAAGVVKDQYKATAIEVLCRVWQLVGLKEVPASSGRYIVIVYSAFSLFYFFLCLAAPPPSYHLRCCCISFALVLQGSKILPDHGRETSREASKPAKKANCRKSGSKLVLYLYLLWYIYIVLYIYTHTHTHTYLYMPYMEEFEK
jgi:hypothetical protein